MTVVAETFIPARSSQIREISYDPGTKEMVIQFKTGTSYRYHDVPVATYQTMTRAPSAGEYFHRHIKGIYSHEPL